MLKFEGGGYVESDEASNNGSFRGSNEHRHSGIDSKRSSKGVLAPANWKGPSKDWPFGVVSDGLENKSTVKKVKLKVGGVTRTIQAKSASDGASAVGLTSTKSSHISDAPRPRKKLILQVYTLLTYSSRFL
jgi:INO80 complex subunit B